MDVNGTAATTSEMGGPASQRPTLMIPTAALVPRASFLLLSSYLERLLISAVLVIGTMPPEGGVLHLLSGSRLRLSCEPQRSVLGGHGHLGARLAAIVSYSLGSPAPILLSDVLS